MALNDYLFSEEFLFEGEQAEEYKKRKAAEKDAAKKADTDDWHRANRRANIGSEPIYRSSKDATEMKGDGDLARKAYTRNGGIDKSSGQNKDPRVRRDMTRRIKSGQSISSKDYNVAYDASRRNARRQSRKESAELYDGHIDLV